MEGKKRVKNTCFQTLRMSDVMFRKVCELSPKRREASEVSPKFQNFSSRRDPTGDWGRRNKQSREGDSRLVPDFSWVWVWSWAL